MSKHRTDLTKNSPFPSTFVNAQQEFISTMASANFALTVASGTALQIVAATGNDQVTVGIMGRWRYVTATQQASHPGGAAGTYDVYVTAADNDLSAADPADATNYAFGLVIRPAGSPPTTALYRKVGTCYWNGTAILRVDPLIGPMPDDSQYAAQWTRGSAVTLNRGDTIPWDTKIDGAGYGTPGSAFVVPVTGVWHFNWRYGINNLLTDYWCDSVLKLNGSDWANGRQEFIGSDQQGTHQSSGDVVRRVAVGSSMTVGVNWKSAVGLSIQPSPVLTWFAATLLRRT